MKPQKKYYVTWEEAHVYRYWSEIVAPTKAEARAKANSHDPDDGCACDFDRVKSISRKKVVEIV